VAQAIYRSHQQAVKAQRLQCILKKKHKQVRKSQNNDDQNEDDANISI